MGAELGGCVAPDEQAVRTRTKSRRSFRVTCLLYLNVKSHTQVERGFACESLPALWPADNGITCVAPLVQAAINAGSIEPGLQQDVAPGLAAIARAADYHDGLVFG